MPQSDAGCAQRYLVGERPRRQERRRRDGRHARRDRRVLVAQRHGAAETGVARDAARPTVTVSSLTNVSE